MASDALLRNLAVIGESVRSLPRETREAMPDVPLASIADLRSIVVHEYFRLNPDLILDIVNHQLVDRASAIRIRMTSAGPSCRYQGGRLAAMTQPA